MVRPSLSVHKIKDHEASFDWISKLNRQAMHEQRHGNVLRMYRIATRGVKYKI